MEVIFLIFASGILYVGIFYSLFFRRNTTLLCFILTYVYFYDYIFIQLGYYITGYQLFIIKSLQEYVMLLILFLIFTRMVILRRIIINKTDLLFFLCIIGPLLINLISSTLSGDSIDSMIRGIRLFYIPILLPYLLFRNGFLQNISFRWIEKCILFLGIITVVYAIYQVYTYNDNLNQLWFYKYYNLEDGTNLVKKSSYNYLRNAMLRATSIFTSSIILTTSLILPLIISIIKIFFTNSRFKIGYFFIFLFFCFGIYLTNTRIGFLMAIMALAILFLKNTKFTFLVMVPIISIGFTFVLLLVSITSDLSALSRLAQYGTFLQNFKFFGLGLGNENVLIKFDSFYISTILMSGLFVLLNYYYYYHLTKKIYNIHMLTSYSNVNKTLIISTLIYSMVLIYAFAFQYMAGSIAVKIFFFLAFLILSN